MAKSRKRKGARKYKAKPPSPAQMLRQVTRMSDVSTMRASVSAALGGCADKHVLEQALVDVSDAKDAVDQLARKLEIK